MNRDSIEIWYWVFSLLVLGITAYVAYFGPIKSVRIGRDLDDRQNKYAAKERLFLTLFAYRGSPLNPRFVDGLNQIDIVFRDTPKVLAAWHIHFRSLHTKNQVDPVDTWRTERMQLLSEMSVALGYGSLDISVAMQHYYPEGHGEYEKKEEDLKQAATVFFQSGFLVNERLIDGTLAQAVPRENDEPAK